MPPISEEHLKHCKTKKHGDSNTVGFRPRIWFVVCFDSLHARQACQSNSDSASVNIDFSHVQFKCGIVVKVSVFFRCKGATCFACPICCYEISASRVDRSEFEFAIIFIDLVSQCVHLGIVRFWLTVIFPILQPHVTFLGMVKLHLFCVLFRCLSAELTHDHFS